MLRNVFGNLKEYTFSLFVLSLSIIIKIGMCVIVYILFLLIERPKVFHWPNSGFAGGSFL